MTIEKAISKCDNTNPNTVDRLTKLDWLNQLDGLVKSEIFDNFTRNEGESEIEYSGYNESTPDSAVLLVTSPYDEIYSSWLIAQVYLLLGENTKYNAWINIFNEQMGRFENYYTRTHSPKITQKILYF